MGYVKKIFGACPLVGRAMALPLRGVGLLRGSRGSVLLKAGPPLRGALRLPHARIGRPIALLFRSLSLALLPGTLTWGKPDQSSDSLACVRALKREVRQLCRFEGRGYAGQGYQKAARYLYRRFQKMGYKTRIDTFQHTIRYVKKAYVRPQGSRAWKVGIDFWPSPMGPSVEGDFVVDTVPSSGKLWLIPDTMPLREAIRQALSNRVRGILRPVRKVNASYADEPLPLLFIETIWRPVAGTRLEVSLHIQQDQVQNYNIIAEKPGKQDSFWILGAHYDHLGRVGRTVFWGANDNASGVAFLLLLARRLSSDTLPYGVMWVAFGGEEAGLLGSYYFVGRHGRLLKRLKGMLNFDLMGYGEKGIAVVGAADQEDFWSRVVHHRPPSLTQVPHLLRPNAPNSDHYPFREKGYPALFFYLQGGPGYYHDPLDRPQTLSWHGAYNMLQWMEALLRAAP